VNKALHAEGVLTLYRRHLKGCPATNLPGRVQRQYTGCQCPIWIYGSTEKETVQRQSLGTSDWPAAESMRRAADAEAKDKAVHGPLLRDCIDRYCGSRTHEVSGGTAGIVRRHLERFRTFAGRQSVIRTDGLTVDILENFKAEGLAGLGELTKNRAVADVRCFLKEAFRRDWIKVHLAAKMKPYKATHEPKDPFTEEEVSQILRAASDGRGAHPGQRGTFQSTAMTFRLLIEPMLETGMRVGDALHFDPRRLREGEGVWCYRFVPEKQSKIKKARPHTVYLSPKLRARSARASGCRPISHSILSME